MLVGSSTGALWRELPVGHLSRRLTEALVHRRRSLAQEGVRQLSVRQPVN